MLNWMIARVLSVVIASTLIVLIFIVIIFVLPRPLPGFQTEVALKTNQPDGILETHYWVGLLKERWSYQGGRPNGMTLQFYPNRSLYRQLPYLYGKLHGIYNEFYEKSRYGRGVGRRGVPPRRREELARGPLKAKFEYIAGKREGPYSLYYENGVVKESGSYQNGRRSGVLKKYSKAGKLLKEKNYGNRSDSNYSLFLDRSS